MLLVVVPLFAGFMMHPRHTQHTYLTDHRIRSLAGCVQGHPAGCVETRLADS